MGVMGAGYFAKGFEGKYSKWAQAEKADPANRELKLRPGGRLANRPMLVSWWAYLGFLTARRYSVTALLCNVSVSEKLWPPEPSARATKYRFFELAGLSAAFSEASPGLAIGPGGKPATL